MKDFNLDPYDLLKLPNVIGCGTGTKIVKGINTGRPCCTVLVKIKVSETDLGDDQIIPKKVGELETDVVEVGEVRALTTEVENRQRHRPVVGGVSISPGNVALSGTGGLPVLQWDKPCILTNNHVIRLSHVPWRQEKGTPVRQPSLPDSGIWDGNYRGDDIGELWDWVEVVFPGPNEVDCAIAKLTVPYVSAILGIGSPVGLAEPTMGEWVGQIQLTKSGRTSGVTAGKIIGIDATIEVEFGGGTTAIFDNQIVSTAFMLAGDSGSVWVTKDNKVMGLGFAGSTTISLANPIQTVFGKLNLTLPPPVVSIEAILPQLGEGAIIWGFDNQTKKWLKYDTTLPERFKHFNDLRYLVPGNGYWVRLDKDIVLVYNGNKWKLWKGWNLIGWL